MPNAISKNGLAPLVSNFVFRASCFPPKVSSQSFLFLPSNAIAEFRMRNGRCATDYRSPFWKVLLHLVVRQMHFTQRPPSSLRREDKVKASFRLRLRARARVKIPSPKPLTPDTCKVRNAKCEVRSAKFELKPQAQPITDHRSPFWKVILLLFTDGGRISILLVAFHLTSTHGDYLESHPPHTLTAGPKSYRTSNSVRETVWKTIPS